MDMLATGMRATLGLKITGSRRGWHSETREKGAGPVLKADPATRSRFRRTNRRRLLSGHRLGPRELGRQGISIEAAQMAVQNAIGGETVTEVIDGRARYRVNVRYMRDFRSDIDSLKEVLVAAPGGREVPCRPTWRSAGAQRPFDDS